MTLVPTNKSKGTLKMYEELWAKIRDLIRSEANNSDGLDENYMEINFNSGHGLPLNKILELRNIITVTRSAFREGNKYYP